jgi:hypothetical protein
VEIKVNIEKERDYQASREEPCQKSRGACQD